MAKSYFILLFALATLSVLAKDSKIIERSQGRITFVVDGNLPFVNYNKNALWDGDRIAAHIIDHRDELEGTYRIVATSFADEQNLSTMDVYTALYTAFAQHRSVTLSPDVIWLLISQGFSRYVNAHAEELLIRSLGNIQCSLLNDDVALDRHSRHHDILIDVLLIRTYDNVLRIGKLYQRSGM